MIKNDFYPNGGTTSYDFDTTAAIMNLPSSSGIKDDMGRQYLMGYCDAEHMPTCCMPAYFSQTSTEISILADYSQNYGFGFAQWGYTGGAAPGNLYYIDDNDILIRAWGVDYDFSFINRGEMCRVNSNPGVEVYIEGLYIRKDMYDGDTCTRLLQGGIESGGIEGLNGEWLSYTFSDFVNMIKNDTPLLDGVYRGRGGTAGQTFNITIRPSDFGDSRDPSARHYVALDDANNDFYAFITIGGFRMGGNTPVYYQNQQYAANIVPFFRIPHNTGKASMIIPGSYMRNSIVFSYSNGAFTGLNRGQYGYNQATDFVNNVIYGAFNNGTLSVNAVNWGEASTYGRGSFFIGNFYGGYLSSGRFYFYAQYTPRDIYNYLCLYHKHTSTPSNDYSSADTVTVFDAAESPTYDTVSGTFSEIASRLRPWQMPNVDITSNTFSPENIPEPEPEDDADSSGDNITDTNLSNVIVGGTNNFITLYALKSDGIADIGKKLWTALSDEDYWKTVGTVLSTNEFSINPADIMRYFLSVRYFPFDLEAHVPHDPFSGIYLGRASKPLTPETGYGYPLRLKRSFIQLSGGTVTIPSKYRDFRDYEPCTTVQLTIPFCGSVDVPASEVMGKTLYLNYKVDLQTGAMLAVIAVSSNTSYVIATLAGSCGASIPITANNNIEFLQRIATVGSSTLHGAASGASAFHNNIGFTGSSVGDAIVYAGGALAGGAVSGASAMLGLPPVTVHKQGNASGFANLGGVNTAYVTIQRQRYEVPSNYGHTSGYACDISATIGNLSGYVVCTNVDTTSIPGFTADEVNEIKRLLESGVYV